MTDIPADPVWGITVGLVIISLLVLLLPFKVKLIEHNLEVFFLIMGILAVTISGVWGGQLVIDALKAPVIIGSLPIGIFQVVLIVSIIVFFFHKKFSDAVMALANRLSIGVFIFIMIASMGLLSSVVSVIPMSVLLAEVVVCLPLNRQDRIKLVVVTCYSIGLGAVLTPLGEPLSTILVQKLTGTPFYAGFTFPFTTFAKYVIPGVLGLAIFGAIWIGRKTSLCKTSVESPYSETWMKIIIRALKVYAFVAALVLLGEGLKPLMVWFLIRTSPAILFWVNMVSAILDNATLTAIEINTGMMLSQIIVITMGLLIAGGMLIPGNIPNIVAAGKLKISMREWAVIGVPIGLAAMIIYFVILLPVILGDFSG
jgi:predicted cation transporter